MESINISKKLSSFTEHWNPKIIAELNGQHVKLAKLKGEFVWHSHALEDEMFFVIDGQLLLHFRDKTITLNAGECCIVPAGIEHKPEAIEEVSIMLFEPATTVNTGAVTSDKTKTKLERI